MRRIVVPAPQLRFQSQIATKICHMSIDRAVRWYSGRFGDVVDGLAREQSESGQVAQPSRQHRVRHPQRVRPVVEAPGATKRLAQDQSDSTDHPSTSELCPSEFGSIESAGGAWSN